MSIGADLLEDLLSSLRGRLDPLGFESHPLKVGWYNALVGDAHQLPYPADTLAVVVLSSPSMFEKTFLPFLKSQSCGSSSDPIDQCVSHTISTCVSQCFPHHDVDVRFDFEMFPNRRPKFLAQTAAHAAGAAYYYRTDDVQEPPWPEQQKMFGVCVHPTLGGWFAIRALLVLKEVLVGAELQQKAPPDCVRSRAERVELLERFNLRWRDWSYRDVVPAAERYSVQQREYFLTAPAQRGALLQHWGLLTPQTSPVKSHSHPPSQ